MISMKNDKIITSWDKIEPGDSANERMLSAILEWNRSVHNGKDKVNYMSKTKKTLLPVVACFALLIAITGIVGNNQNWFTKDNTAGAGIGEDEIQAGSMPEGIDPIVASIAVYPADKSLSDVADATLNEINESEAKAIELGNHFPTAIPEGYRFKVASIYETTMKDGTKYHLLRLHYTAGDNDNADMSIHSDEFFIQFTDFQPNTEKTIYTIDTLSNVYVVFNAGDLTNADVMSVLNSIN